MAKPKLDKKKLEDTIKNPEVTKKIRNDPRTKEAMGGINDFLEVACKPCGRKLKIGLIKLVFMKEANQKKWIDKKICSDCKKFLV